MRIGDTIDAGLNQIDYSPYLQAQQRATSVIGDSIAQGVGAVGDAIKDRREKKDKIKVSKELAKALSTLYPESATSVAPIIEQLDNEELPLSQRAALGEQIGTLINMGVEKNRNEALMSLERSRLKLDTRRVDLAEDAFNREGQNAVAAAMSENDMQVDQAIAIGKATADAAKMAGIQLPEDSTSLLNQYLQEENGPGALAMAEAQAKAIDKFITPQGGKKLAQIGADGGTLDVFIEPSGAITDLQGNPLNQAAVGEGVLPPKPGEGVGVVPMGEATERRIPAMPPNIGFRPAAGAQTPAQARKEELEIAKLEADIKSSEADAAVAQRAEQKAATKARTTLETLKEIRNHPGRWAATGKTSYIPSVRGTPAYEFEQKLEQAKALAGTIGIEAMRGLGAMSEKEFEAAKASIAQLEKGQRTETIERELDKLILLFESGLSKSESAEQENPTIKATSTLRSLKPPAR